MAQWTQEQKDAARDREIARRNATSSPENSASATEPEATPTAVDSALISLIKDLTEKVGKLEARIALKDAATPRMIPMGAMDLPNIGTAHSGMKAGEERDGGQQLPIGSNGLRLNDNVFRAFEQAFNTGQQVRINPESTRDGSNETWGTLLNKMGTISCPTKIGRSTCRTEILVNTRCPRCGAAPTVKGVRYLSKAGEWKYIVRVPGLTARQGLGDGFAQSELLPA